jgi:hypothetical protein
MSQLINWYFLPNSILINGDIKINNQFQFIQQKVNSISYLTDNSFLINDKYIINMIDMDRFFSNTKRINKQEDFIAKYLM